MAERPRNEFVHCECGVVYISGYTHCPVCGRKNPNDEIKQLDLIAKKHKETIAGYCEHDTTLEETMTQLGEVKEMIKNCIEK